MTIEQEMKYFVLFLLQKNLYSFVTSKIEFTSPLYICRFEALKSTVSHFTILDPNQGMLSSEFNNNPHYKYNIEHMQYNPIQNYPL